MVLSQRVSFVVHTGPKMEPLVKTNTYERGCYFCFDPNSWKTTRKDNFVVQYEMVEKRPVLPPEVKLILILQIQVKFLFDHILKRLLMVSSGVITQSVLYAWSLQMTPCSYHVHTECAGNAFSLAGELLLLDSAQFVARY